VFLLALLVVGFTVASQFTDNRFVDSIPSRRCRGPPYSGAARDPVSPNDV
jgi:hypothetical protein